VVPTDDPISVIFYAMNGWPTWIPPTIAISLVLIALAHVAVATTVVVLIRHLQHELDRLQRRLNPLIDTVDRIADAGEDIGDRVKEEVGQILRTSRYVRRGVVRGVRRVRGRLQDLDALYEVVGGEVQDTALDLAAKLRTVRSGASMLQRIRRLVRRGRR
jgi:uncharacterized protein YoxC